MIVILDYGMGNAGSLQNMIQKFGGACRVSADRADIARADKLVLPGVGAFDNGMERLHELGLVELLNEKVLAARTPILCICLGAELITRNSEEGARSGLAWIDARTVRFEFAPEAGLKIPHMGWGTVDVRKDSVLFRNAYADSRFYFVHSYHVVCDRREDVLATSRYGVEFVAALQRDNIYATQFHPEKSHKCGLLLMRNFVELA